MDICLTGVVKRFDNKSVLNGISLDIKDGQFVALLGPSGCGKTTLLNALAGLVEVDGGAIEVGGDVWSTSDYLLPVEKRNVGMVFQDFALWPHMSVFENVAFGLKLQRQPSYEVKQRVQEVLDMVQMTGYTHHLPHQLSGGQKQRIAIARALAPRPRVMLMDEPLSSLDAKLREHMRWDLLHWIRQSGTTTVYVTHDQIEALTMADHIVLLNEGNVEQQGKPTDLYERPKTVFTATFIGTSNLISGSVADTDGEVAQLKWGEHCVAIPDVGLTDETVTVAVRPHTIQIGDVDPHATQRGTLLTGRIVQRAFHGVTWQYKVHIGDSVPAIEVWDEVERAIDDRVSILIPRSDCHVVSRSRDEVAVTPRQPNH